MAETNKADGYFDWPNIPACAGCRHYRNILENGKHPKHGYVCHYLLDTGRKRPCPMGEGCTVKEVR